MAESRDRSPAQRFSLRAPAIFEDQRGPLGEGFVENISRSGVLLERCSARLTPGEQVWLRASYFPGSTEVAIESQVVRRTDRGFAVKFVNTTTATRRLIDHILPV